MIFLLLDVSERRGQWGDRVKVMKAGNRWSLYTDSPLIPHCVTKLLTLLCGSERRQLSLVQPLLCGEVRVTSQVKKAKAVRDERHGSGRSVQEGPIMLVCVDEVFQQEGMSSKFDI